MSTLSEVWGQVEAMLAAGISVIPVRDRESVYQGRVLKPKVPFKDWKVYQTNIITKEQLWHDLEEHNTTAVAMVCGKVSGNLEAIDIDVKYQPGIDAQLFAAIKDLYPDIGKRLRVHRSPSGGYHLLYRVDGGEIPGNAQLALRSSTDEEMAVSPKRKKVAFIETRGEGGYIMCPPSFGYRLLRNPEIPTLTWAERCSLIELCRTFNLYIRPAEKPYAPPKSDDYYALNPWEDYNNRVAPEDLLESFGWARVAGGGSGDKIYFTRPGGTKGDTHGTFSKSLRKFYVYSSNTGLDCDRAYNLGTLLSFYQFSGDKKKTYAYLVSQGYGQIRASVENRLVKSKALKGKELPANTSQEARENYTQEIERVQSKFPYGVFWARDSEDKIRISREGLYIVCMGFGFHTYQQEVVRVVCGFIHQHDERFLFDTIKSYIQDEDAEEYEEILNAYEAFLQKSGTFTISRIPILDDSRILYDTSTTCYKFYQNGYVTIQDSGYIFTPYTDQLGKLIWYRDVRQRDWTSKPVHDPLYLQYLKLATRFNEHTQYIQRIIGYLAHGYKDETTGYIIVLTEEANDPQNGGGSGKNVWCNLFKQVTTLKNIPASQVTYDEKFLQYWNGERILTISDAPKNLDFTFFKELSTGSGLQKKLYRNQMEIQCKLMPKFIVQTNHSFEVTDGGLRRRLIPIEFTDFFTKTGGVDIHFGCYFPDDWQPHDWSGFDHFMAECVQEWLIGGLKLRPQALSLSGWKKQFVQEFGVLTAQFIEENWDGWCQKINVRVTDFNLAYDTFCVENNIFGKYKASAIKMNNALNAYAKHKEASYISNHVVRDSNSTIKYKKFLEKAPF